MLDCFQTLQLKPQNKTKNILESVLAGTSIIKRSCFYVFLDHKYNICNVYSGIWNCCAYSFESKKNYFSLPLEKLFYWCYIQKKIFSLNVEVRIHFPSIVSEAHV